MKNTIYIILLFITGCEMYSHDDSLEQRLRECNFDHAWNAGLLRESDRDLLEFLEALWSVMNDDSLPEKAHSWAGQAFVDTFSGSDGKYVGGTPLDYHFHIPTQDYDRIVDAFFIDKYLASKPHTKQWRSAIIALHQRHSKWADEFIIREKVPAISTILPKAEQGAAANP